MCVLGCVGRGGHVCVPGKLSLLTVMFCHELKAVKKTFHSDELTSASLLYGLLNIAFFVCLATQNMKSIIIHYIFYFEGAISPVFSFYPLILKTGQKRLL